MSSYLRDVSAHLGGLGSAAGELVVEELRAQLAELLGEGLDPEEVLGPPDAYAAALVGALVEEPDSGQPLLRVLGMPVETRGVASAEVRSRVWAPSDPRVFVPRLLGVGWTLNLGALAVRLGLIRPDDATPEVMELIPGVCIGAAQAVPVVIAGSTIATLVRAWGGLPAEVATGFGLLGRRSKSGSRTSLVATAGLGAGTAFWSAGGRGIVDDRLVRAAVATTVSAATASVVSAAVLDARQPRGRWGLLVFAAIPTGVATALAVVVVPVRVGLRKAWRAAGVSGR